MISNEELISAAHKIRKYCYNNTCESCPFCQGEDKCYFAENLNVPANWFLPSGKRKISQKEYDLLNAVAGFGFDKIFTDGCGNTLAYKDDDLEEWSLPSGSFKFLIRGTTYKISELLDNCETVGEKEE